MDTLLMSNSTPITESKSHMDPLWSSIYLLLFTFSLLYYFLINKKTSGGSGSGNSKKKYGPLPPGPKGWPILGNLSQLGAKPHQTLSALSKVYGPLFYLRFGSVDVVVAASATVAAQFLRTLDANFCNRPPNSGAEHIAYNYQDLVFAPYGSRWRMLRKLCALHLFSHKALDDLRPVRAREVSILASSIYTHHSTHLPIDLGQALTVCTSNALSMAMLGLRLFNNNEQNTEQKMIVNEEASEFKEMVMELMRLSGVFNVGDFIPALRPLDLQCVVRKMKRLHRRLDEFLDRVIEKHKAVKGDDLLSVMMRLKDNVDGDGGKLTDTNIKALLLDLFTAGTDTSSSTVEWALSELIRHPDILKKAQAELDTVVGRARLVSESDLPNLPYLQAVIKETFRLHPSTPLSLPHMSSDDCEVNGYHIPKNATLLVNIWAISRDPAVWDNPLEFCPDRFLPGGGFENVDVKGNDFELIPFGAGRRICAGLSLGLRMVQFLTATLIHGFDWGLGQGQTIEKLDMEEAFGLTLQRAVPLVVHPVPRLDKKAFEIV